MRQKTLNNHGLSIISVLIGSLIILVSFWAYVSFENYTLKNQTNFREKYMAKLYALELIEFFRGYNSSKSILKDFMGAAIPLCTRINELNRTNGNMTRADSHATLPVNYLDSLATHGKSFRYYQIDVVDVTQVDANGVPTLARSTNYCPPPAGTSALTANNITLAANERLLITVGMNWVPHGKPVADATTLEVTSIVPGE